MGNRERIFAHRGLWLEFGHNPNSEEALAEAVIQGFSLETDIRDLDGDVVISHDPPTRMSPSPSLGFLLNLVDSSALVTLALNVKSDGLGKLLEPINCDHFFFDMSFPERVKYLQAGLPVAERVSEFEQPQLNPSEDTRVWLDMFHFDWILERAYAITGPTVLVSPELHGRDPSKVWRWVRENWTTFPVSICTDMPLKFERYLVEGVQ